MTITRRDFGAMTFAAALIPTADAAAADGPSRVPATSPLVTFEGRTLATPAGGVVVGWPAVTLHLRARSSSVTLDTTAKGDDVYLDVIVDGAPARTVHLRNGPQRLSLVEGAFAERRIKVVARGEAFNGIWEIAGVALDRGRLLPVTLPPRKLMFIGDSITAGYYDDAQRTDTAIGPATSDADLSYARILARRLDAQTHVVAKSGAGLYRDNKGSFGETLPALYERTVMNDPAPRWNPARYVPDAIGICLGTNDFNQGIPDQATYVACNVAFLQKLRRDAPGAPIILVDSPMLDDRDSPKRSVLSAYLDRTIAQLGDDRVWHAAVRHYAGRPVNSHPIREDNEAIASEVEPLFRKALRARS